MPKRRLRRGWVVLAYLVLLALVIPWYWPPGDTRHLYGVPLWVIATLGALLLTSAFTSWVFMSWLSDATDE